MVEQDLLILGTGAAGMTASIYALRYKIQHALLGEVLGGTFLLASVIENYPGIFPIKGVELAKKFQEHVEYLGGAVSVGQVSGMRKEDDRFVVTTDKETYKSRAVLYTLGTMHRHLHIPGEKEFEGKGVSYCASCDGFFFKDKTVAVIGGGDSAATAVLVLANVAKKVYMIYRGTELRAEPTWVEQIRSLSHVEVIFQTNVSEIKGTTKVQEIVLDNSYQGNQSLSVDGIFIEIGQDPNSHFAQQIGVEVDKSGYVKVQEDMSTNIPGLYAAGDVTTGSGGFRQLVTAASEGAIAAFSIYKYLKGKK